MKRKRLKKIHEALVCKDSMEEKVLGFADGSLEQNEADAVLEHIANCDACRYLLEDFEPIDFDVQQIELPKVSIAISNNEIIHYSSQYKAVCQPVAVLGNTSKCVEYTFQSGDEEIMVQIVPMNNMVTMTIYTPKQDAVYYLLFDDDYKQSHVYNGQVMFENLPNGKFTLSEDMRYFFQIEIEKK
ncbi:MAG: zf-HC2 domain-containing protein [Spirochaetota bacterium]